jgi:hypothetical protein
MLPEEFRERFIKAHPKPPAELNIDLAEFVEFDGDVLDGVDLSERDKEFLATAGLPKSAAPFLSFHAWGEEDQASIGGIPAGSSVFALGHNAYGDAIVIDLHSGEVVYFNHDRNMERVFVNSNVAKLAESLCVFAEHSIAGKWMTAWKPSRDWMKWLEIEEASGS